MNAFRREIIFTGNPNAGKSTLFNALTGAHARTGNWHGVTVGALSKAVKSPRGRFLYTDLPGIYSLDGYSMEEKGAADYLRGHKNALLVNVADVRTLSRSLRLTRALIGAGYAVVLALTMCRAFRKNGGSVNVSALSAALGVPVFAVDAFRPHEVKAFNSFLQGEGAFRAAHARKTGEKDEGEKPLPRSVYVPQKRKAGFIEKICYNRALCLPLFFCLMGSLFFLTFGRGMPGAAMKSWLEELICVRLADAVGAHLSVPAVRALVCDGFFRSAGGVLSFLPQLAMLYGFLLFMEESGYMSALAFTADGVFRKFGLNGRAVFCVLLGFGCTAQAILSTRGFENRAMQKRTICALPYISCSAKLPVYLTLLSSFFARPFLAVAGLYALGVVVSLLVFSFLSRGEKGEFILELPEMQLPDPIFFVKTLLFRLKQFIIKIVTVVTAFTLAVWFFSSFNFSLRYVPAEESMLAFFSDGLKYVFYPVGVRDWETAFALFSGLVAKENVAGLLTLFYPAGLPYTAPTAFALAVFVLFCSPCISAIAASAREIGWKDSLCSAVLQTATAVLAAYAAYFLFVYRIFIPAAAVLVLLLAAGKRLCFERIHRKERRHAQKFHR